MQFKQFILFCKIIKKITLGVVMVIQFYKIISRLNYLIFLNFNFHNILLFQMSTSFLMFMRCTCTLKKAMFEIVLVTIGDMVSLAILTNSCSISFLAVSGCVWSNRSVSREGNSMSTSMLRKMLMTYQTYSNCF